MIDAISETKYELDIYGKGNLKDELILYAKKKRSSVFFKGVVKNSDLPVILNRYKFYILPSFYEGMPKTLLEAMSCGCACIGTNVEGVSEVISHGSTGFLANDTSKESLKTLLEELIAMNCDEIVKNGVKNIEDNYSLKSRVVLEWEIIKGILDE